MSEGRLFSNQVEVSRRFPAPADSPKNVCSGHDEPRAPTSGMFFQALSCHLNDYRVLTVLRGCTVHAVGGTSPIFRFERSRWDTLIQICTGSTLHFYTK